MTVYRATYTYLGDKYDGGTYDSKAEAQDRMRELRRRGFHGARVTPQEHACHKYCPHNA